MILLELLDLLGDILNFIYLITHPREMLVFLFVITVVALVVFATLCLQSHNGTPEPAVPIHTMRTLIQRTLESKFGI